MFDQTTAAIMGDGSHRSRSPVQSSCTDTPGTSASTPTSSSEDGHDKLLGVDPDYCRRILVRGQCPVAESRTDARKDEEAGFPKKVRSVVSDLAQSAAAPVKQD